MTAPGPSSSLGATEFFRFDPQAVPLDEGRVLRLIGYPRGVSVHAAVNDALPRTIRAVRDLAEPVAMSTLHAIQMATPDAVRLASGATFHGERLGLALHDAQQAAVFVLTLGPRVSAAAQDPADDPFAPFLFDSVASILAETVADEFQARLEGQMNRQGAWGGLRYSPGYCDWSIEENRTLLQTIDAQRIGVRLTTGGMMAPRKSISGIIGFGADAAKIRVNPCRGCPHAECDHRRDQRRTAMDSNTSAS